jgi:hypothetical protein
MTVVPRGVAPRRQYGHAAIAMAFALWAIAAQPIAEVRRRVCAWRVGYEPPTYWPTLARWARAVRDVRRGGSLRAAAERAAQLAIGRAPPSTRHEPRWAQAFAGGSAMP